ERQPIIIYRKCGHAALTSQGNNSVSRDIRRVATAGYPFRDHNESLTARVTLCSPTDAATFDTILDNSISWCRRNDIQSDID
ncbi:TPA: hypothetical protein ACITU8_004361, partial [Salmonella enterica subsp. enterica serovar Saintpaul]